MTFELARHLEDRYRLLIFDRPGLGYTDRINRSGATITQQADLLSKLPPSLAPRETHRLPAKAMAALSHWPGRCISQTASRPWCPSRRLQHLENAAGPLLPHRFAPLGSARSVIPLLTAFVTDSYVDKVMATVFEPQPEPKGYGAYFGPGLTLRRKSLRANALQRANLLGEIHALYPRYG